MSDEETKILIPEEMKTLKTDDRGRAYTGYKNSKVKVAVLEVEPDE